MLICALAGMSADVPSNPAVGLLWISRRLQGMGIPFPFTVLPGSNKGKDAFSLLPSHRLEPGGVCVPLLFIHHVYVLKVKSDYCISGAKQY